MKEENESPQRMPQKLEIVIGIGVIAIVFPAVWLTWFLASYLGIDLKQMSFFLAYRTLLQFFLLVSALPMALFGEFLTKKWKKRRFLWKSVFTGIGILGVFGITVFSLLTVSDAMLSGLNIIWQIPIAAMCSSLGLIAVSVVAKSERFKQFARIHLGY